MEFIRIDENTVRCIVSEDDMREYDVEIEDFIKNRNKVQEFLHTIVERASDEVGYEPKDGLLAMQIMMLPKNRLAITFSEKEEGDDGISDLIQQIAGATIEKSSSIDGLFEEDEVKTEQPEAKVKEKVKVASVMPIQIFRFETLNDFEQFCSILLDKLTIKSSLYKDEKQKVFYAVIEKGRLSKVNFGHVCRMATEYGTFVSDRQERKAYIEEHMDCVVKNRAVKIIKKMIQAGF